MADNFITRRGLIALEQRLHELEEHERELILSKKRAAEFGDIGYENAEYDSAEQDLDLLRRNKAQLSAMLAGIRVYSGGLPSDEVTFGKEVLVSDRDTLEYEAFRIVGPVDVTLLPFWEDEPDSRIYIDRRSYVSIASPLGQALLGRHAGSTVQINRGDGTSRKLVILGIDEFEDFEKWICPIVGVHTSGKSSLISLADRMGFKTYGEIAQEYIDGGVRLGISSTSYLQSEIMRRESERDQQLFDIISNKGGPIFVETWHIGNLAHAYMTAPDITEKYLEKLNAIVRRNKVFAFFLKLDPEKIPQRTALESEEPADDVVRFHSQVQQYIERIMSECLIQYRIIDANESLSAISERFQDITSVFQRKE